MSIRRKRDSGTRQHWRIAAGACALCCGLFVWGAGGASAAAESETATGGTSGASSPERSGAGTSSSSSSTSSSDSAGSDSASTDKGSKTAESDAADAKSSERDSSDADSTDDASVKSGCHHDTDTSDTTDTNTTDTDSKSDSGSDGGSTQTPVAETDPPVAEPDPPVAEPDPPTVNPDPPVTEPEPPPLPPLPDPPAETASSGGYEAPVSTATEVAVETVAVASTVTADTTAVTATPDTQQQAIDVAAAENRSAPAVTHDVVATSSDSTLIAVPAVTTSAVEVMAVPVTTVVTVAPLLTQLEWLLQLQLQLLAQWVWRAPMQLLAQLEWLVQLPGCGTDRAMAEAGSGRGPGGQQSLTFDALMLAAVLRQVPGGSLGLPLSAFPAMTLADGQNALAVVGRIATTGLAEAASLVTQTPTTSQKAMMFPVANLLTMPAVSGLVRASLWALLGVVLAGLGGLVAISAVGVRIGYRQAKAGLAMHRAGIARFARAGPIGVVRSGSFVSVRPRPSQPAPAGAGYRFDRAG